MGTLLVVDGSDVCRAPIVSFALGQVVTETVRSRGLTAQAGATMCDNAAARIGYSGPAISFYGAHRAERLTVDDIAGADLILTAERVQRSAVVRMLPGTQAAVFTWKEALSLAGVLVDRGRAAPVEDLAALARALHGARGTVPLVEMPVRTGVFHWRRAANADPLTIESGHRGAAEHRRVTQESLDVAGALSAHFAALLGRTRQTTNDAPAVDRRRQLRRSA